MKHLIGLFLVLFSVYAHGACEDKVAFGKPRLKVVLTDSTELCRTQYAVLHDNKLKTPIYSAQHLTRENIDSRNKRVDVFRPDPDLLKGKRAELSDYEIDRMYDRGHLTPVEDAKWSRKASDETFYLSNIVPQELSMNRGIWRSIENKTRQSAWNNEAGVYVITGPVYAKTSEKIGDGIMIPTGLYKVVINKEKKQGVAYYVPNVKPISGIKPQAFKMPISELETKININFTPGLRAKAWKSQIGEEFKN